MATETAPRRPAWRVAARLAWPGLRRPGALALAAALALGLASAGLAAVGSLGARLSGALESGTAELMGGDVQVSATADLRARAAALPAPLAPDAVAIELPTMAAGGAALALVELKAVSEAYPLYGALRLAGRAGPAPLPPPGSAYVDRALLDRLGVAVGDALELGSARVRIAGVIAHEPDRLAAPFRLGPRVLIGLADLDATGLVQPLSRLRTDLLYRAPRTQDALAAQLRAALGPAVEVRTAAQGLETTRGLLAQASDYLRIAGALALAVALAAAGSVDALLAREARSAAVLRALGAPRGALAAALAGPLLALAVLAGIAGALGGAGLAWLSAQLLRDLLPAQLPPLGWLPLVQGAGTAAALALAMGVPALRRLAALPPAAVLRETVVPDTRTGAAGLALGALAAAVLVLAPSRAPGTSAAALGALAVLAAGMLLAARALARALARPARGPLVWRYAAAALARALGHTTLAIGALALAVLAALAPALVASDLLAQWERRVPPDAPNRFLIDIQPDQREGVMRILAAHGVHAPLHPVVRARLTAVNGAPPRVDDARTRRLAEREQNLTVAAQHDPENRIVAGRFWRGVPAAPEVSVEADFADTLGIGLGDALTFDVTGTGLTARVTSLREVAWETLRPNFFLVLSPGALEAVARTYITAYRVPPQRAGALERALTRAYPNLTVFDLEAIARRLGALVDRLAAGTGALAAAAALAGAAVLLAALLAERAALTREAALLRALGASSAQVRRLYALRFGLLGAVAGVIGAAAALAAGALACAYLLEVLYRPDLRVAGGAVLAAGALAAALGALGTRAALRAPPLAVLRARA